MTDLAAALGRISSSPDILSAVLEDLSGLPELHRRGSGPYQELAALIRPEIERRFSNPEAVPQAFGPFGALSFPFHKMGAVDSLNLFDLDELIIFSFYWANRELYSRAADVGANLGLHSCVLSRAGFEVRCYEPDPTHFELLQRNLAANECQRVTPLRRAISGEAGRREFVRVLGNTTGSHLSGAKSDPYGELERFEVEVEAVAETLEWADFLKIDAEGEEAKILGATDPKQWVGTDAIVEVGSSANAEAIWNHFQGTSVRLFAQKLGWSQVTDLTGIPTTYREGSLFLTCREAMPWGSRHQ